MIPGILLAAGLSRRFGSQKLLAPLHEGETLFDHSLRVHLEAPVSPLIVVVSKGLFRVLSEPGRGAFQISPGPDFSGFLLENSAGIARLIVNEAPETGMANSLKLGFSALQEMERGDGVLISLADMPRITPEIITRLIEQYRREGAKIMVPTFAGRIGHPVIIHEPSFRGEISEIEGDKGLRDIIKTNKAKVTFVPWDDDSVIADIDTPSDLKNIRGEEE